MLTPVDMKKAHGKMLDHPAFSIQEEVRPRMSASYLSCFGRCLYEGDSIAFC